MYECTYVNSNRLATGWVHNGWNLSLTGPTNSCKAQLCQMETNQCESCLNTLSYYLCFTVCNITVHMESYYKGNFIFKLFVYLGNSYSCILTVSSCDHIPPIHKKLHVFPFTVCMKIGPYKMQCLKRRFYILFCGLCRHHESEFHLPRRKNLLHMFHPTMQKIAKSFTVLTL